MQGMERITVLMTLMEQLRSVMAEENTLVRQMKLDRLSELNAEKSALADAYESELRKLRNEPQLMAAIPEDLRDHLEEVTRNFQKASSDNANVLDAARTMVERMMRRLGESMQARLGGAKYGASNVGAGQPTGEVIPVAFNRQL